MMRFKEVVLKLIHESSKEICFSLDNDYLKPIFVSDACVKNNSFTCMLDTGAAIPVWCSGSKQLNKTFPSAEYRSDLKTILSGFGTGFQVADVYCIPELEFNNGDGSFMRFTEFYLPVIERRTFGVDLIFPSAMLKETNILLCDSESKSLEKSLFIQNSSLHYKSYYSYRHYPVSAINKIKEICRIQDINIHTKFIGDGKEFYKILIQNDDAGDSEISSKEMNAF